MHTEFSPPPSFKNELHQYIALLRRWLWLIVLITAFAGAAAYLASMRVTPVYQASTTVLVNEAGDTQSEEYRLNITSDQLPRTYAEMMTNSPVLERVREELNLSMDVTDLSQAISVQPLRDTQLIKITVEDTNPSRAATIANTLVDVFANHNESLQTTRFASYEEGLQTRISQVEQQIETTRTSLSTADESERERLRTALEQYRQVYTDLLQNYERVRFTEVQSTSNIVAVEPAATPDSPIRPRTLTNTLLAAVVGAMLAVGAVFLYEYLDTTLKDPEMLAQSMSLPVLGLIARHDTTGSAPVAAASPRSPVTEAFRVLRTNIQYAGVDRPLDSLIFTSAEPGVGKSTVLANLAHVLAQSGQQVLLVEGDLRRPTLHRQMELSNRVGLANLFLREDMPVERVIRETGHPNLFVLPAGETPPNPSELLGSGQMQATLSQLRARFDRVLIDTPPLLAVTDAAVLAPSVAGVVLVAKPGETKVPALQQAVQQLRHVGATIVGVVLNDVDLGDTRYGYYYDSYYYAYEQNGSTPEALHAT